MSIAIMGAMTEEIEPLLEFFKEYKTIEFANNTYYTTTYKGEDIVIAYSKIGKVNAALTATVLCQKFGAQKLLFSGVAGAISSELQIGDLMYATQTCQHDLDITAFGHPFGFVPEGAVFVKSDEKLQNIASKVASSLGLKLQAGTIATGDQFVASNERKEWIAKTFQADALEMEGASVAVVCDALGVPFFILRAISDSADMDAGFDFDAFLKSSSKVSADFIVKMLDEIL